MKTLIAVMLAGMLLATGALAQTAADIIQETNFTGGLIVHLGCGDGKLTAALRVNDRCLVHGLDTDSDAAGEVCVAVHSQVVGGRVRTDSDAAGEVCVAVHGQVVGGRVGTDSNATGGPNEKLIRAG